MLWKTQENGFKSFERLFFTDATPNDIGTVDVRFARFEEGSTAVMMSRLKRVSASELRGHRISSPHLFRFDNLILEPDGTLKSSREYCQWMGIDPRESNYLLRNRWHLIQMPGWYENRTPETVAEIRTALSMSLGVAFSARYDWSVSLGLLGSAPVLSFPTDPIGALEAFKARDREPGKSRRDPLRHWVERHWRKTGDYRESEVREHLRGKIEFDLGGYHWQLSPSEYDLEREKIAKARKVKQRFAS